jgi:HlyD family secretion protein
MKNRKIWIGAGVPAMALVVWAFVGRGAGDEQSFRFAVVERGSIESVVTATGVLQPTETVEVGTQVSGQIAELYVDFNDPVKAGQLLARIDPTILQQEVQSAQASVMRNQAEVDQAARGLERSRELYAERVITETELEQAQYSATVANAALTSAQVSLARARRNLSYTEVRAPIDGIVVERTADLGQTVAASMSAPTLFLLAQDLSQMQILASVDEGDIGRITTGQEVRFTVQAYGDATFRGTVQQVRLQSKTQDNVVSYSVVIGVQNTDGRLLPAMTATVEFIVAQAASVLRVPNAALRFQPTEEMRAAVAAQAAASSGGTGAASAGDAQGDGSRNDGSRIDAARNDAAPRNAARSDAAPRDPARTEVLRNGAARGESAVVRARLWHVGEDGVVAVFPVVTGLTDGQYTEVRGPALREGMQVITGVTTSDAAQAAPNPFQGAQGAPAGPGGPPRF